MGKISKLKKNNRNFEILVPKTIKDYKQIRNFPNTQGVKKIT